MTTRLLDTMAIVLGIISYTVIVCGLSGRGTTLVGLGIVLGGLSIILFIVSDVIKERRGE